MSYSQHIHCISWSLVCLSIQSAGNHSPQKPLPGVTSLLYWQASLYFRQTFLASRPRVTEPALACCLERAGHRWSAFSSLFFTTGGRGCMGGRGTVTIKSWFQGPAICQAGVMSHALFWLCGILVAEVWNQHCSIHCTTDTKQTLLPLQNKVNACQLWWSQKEYVGADCTQTIILKYFKNFFWILPKMTAWFMCVVWWSVVRWRTAWCMWVV